MEMHSEDLETQYDTLYFKVLDDAMIGDRIFAGDVVLIRKQKVVSPKDIAFLMRGNQLTLGRILINGRKTTISTSKPYLMSETSEEIYVIGKVIKTYSFF
jgi:repressor LexA